MREATHAVVAPTRVLSERGTKDIMSMITCGESVRGIYSICRNRPISSHIRMSLYLNPHTLGDGLPNVRRFSHKDILHSGRGYENCKREQALTRGILG